MIQLPEDRRPPLTPQLALRVAMIGTFAFAMFAIIFFRLWFLQVLSGQNYLAQAQTNRTRQIAVPAPRGEIVDRSGRVLVDSRRALAVQISPPDLPVRIQPTQVLHPPRQDVAMYTRLAHVLGVSTKRTRCPVPGVGVGHMQTIACIVAQKQATLPYANATIKRDVSKYVQYYLAERQEQFPGVEVEQIYLRDYPLHQVAAQLFGTVGPIDQAEIKEARYRGVSQNAVVGKTGLEWYYDKYLRGRDGADKVSVDSLGRFTGNISHTPPAAGHNLRLSLDVGLQKAGQAALQDAIDNNPPANGGAFVAMNPQNGQIYAMGSNPTFDPNIFTKNLSEKTYKALNNPASNFPLINRAIQSAGPTGSTFKPITATAALESGAWTTSDTFDDTGQFCVSGQCRHNAGGAVDGVLDLVNAIRVSSDDFFYNLGALTNADPGTHPNGGALQQWARTLGIGHRTGIDLRGEVSGTLPTPRWRQHINDLEAECDRAKGPTALFPTHPHHSLPPGGCGIADGTNRPWSIGDNISLAVGQGDVQATPLQLAVAYSAIENGGKVLRPHIGLDAEDPDGTVRQRFDPPPARTVSINPQYLDTIRAGLRAAASQPGGTSADIFSNFPEQVYGKTGTAQYSGQQDYSWYACFVPSWATRTPILVVVWVEQGGFGAMAAAPAAREILSQWFFGKRGGFVAGSSKTL
jgi:penicillin-binding protein 2